MLPRLRQVHHEQLEAGFAELDRAFAHSLGLPIHRSGKDRERYTIAEILRCAGGTT